MLHRNRALALLVVALFTLVPFAPQPVRAADPTCRDPDTFQLRTATKFLSSAGTLVGTNGPDVLVGSSGDDIINGLGGDDLICGGLGNDHSSGGSGNDKIVDFVGPDNFADGGSGKDFITGFNSGNAEKGFAGDANGGTGNDLVRVTNGIAHGNAGNDIVSVTPGQSFGDAGDDHVDALGNSVADGGSGNDELQRFLPGFTIRGGSGNDNLAVFSEQGVLIDGGSGRRDVCQNSPVPTINCEVIP